MPNVHEVARASRNANVSPGGKLLQFSKGAINGRSNGRHDTTITNDYCDAPAAACVTQARKLNALISTVTGGGFGHFDSLSDDTKENLLWLMKDLSNEVVVLGEMASEHASSATQEAHHG